MVIGSLPLLKALSRLWIFPDTFAKIVHRARLIA
jgi:hypothetical protein